ncbi:DUF2312 domain-containing protein [Sneathiella marina]|uniref:UPF0335 protein NBZ79_07675 n=1 Tax=Sneathiella marina TaxID=2950108 RepID=A0ABY4WC82_9PROT|nr:DUF2312 domain-containing protein [Sneathiella marina]USG62854.1 DUF2312 domain-containing protein [Sneathiella marina]
MADVGGVAADHLRSYIERIERLEEEKKGLADDIKEIFAEAKGTGFDVKAMRAVMRLRKMDKADYQEQEYMIDLYKHALGMIDEMAPAGEGEEEATEKEAAAF